MIIRRTTMSETAKNYTDDVLRNIDEATFRLMNEEKKKLEKLVNSLSAIDESNNAILLLDTLVPDLEKIYKNFRNIHQWALEVCNSIPNISDENKHDT